jgi:hypothetical protein
MWSTIESFFGKASTIIGGFLLILGLVAYFGFNINTPSENIEKIEVKLNKLQETLDEQGKLLEATVRSSCIEHPKEDLERLGMMKACKELGIER